MNWKVKEKQAKIKQPKIEKPKPNIGDKKEKVRFALLPTKVLDRWIWFERYISIYEYKSYPYIRYEETADFILWQEYRGCWDTWVGFSFIGRRFLENTGAVASN